MLDMTDQYIELSILKPVEVLSFLLGYDYKREDPN